MRAFIHYFIVLCIKAILKIVYLFPIKRNKVLFISFNGRQYSCSPKYIYEYLRENHKGKFDYVWVFSDVNRYKFLEEDQTKIVRLYSLAYIYQIMTAKIVVTNHFFSSWIPFRKEQVLINTWHGGGAYKKSGLKSENWTGWDLRLQEHAYKRLDYYISSNRIASQQRLREDCGYQGVILECGMPRNDVFFKDYSGISNKVKEALNIDENTKIVLYAPTYRANNLLKDYELDYKLLRETLKKKFGGQWIVLFRGHYFLAEDFSNINLKNQVINVSNYPDMQELLCAANVLITDYSSCIWDFSFTKKPCFLYATDLEKYKIERNFYVGIDKWPFPCATNNRQLAQVIKEFDDNRYFKNIQEHHYLLGSFEKGTACKEVAELIFKKCYGKK